MSKAFRVAMASSRTTMTDERMLGRVMKAEHREALDAVHVGGLDDLVRDGLDRGREDGHREPGLDPDGR